MSELKKERDNAIRARDDHMRSARRLASLLVKAQDELRQCASLLDESEKFVTSQTGRIQKLEADIARRDANEARNCLNWGPCSQHNGRMAGPDDIMVPLP